MKTNEKAFDPGAFRAALICYLAMVGVFLFGGFAVVLGFAAVFGLIAMMAGELALVHVLALLCMAGGFGMLAALCAAVDAGYGVDIFRTENQAEAEEEEETA